MFISIKIYRTGVRTKTGITNVGLKNVSLKWDWASYVSDCNLSDGLRSSRMGCRKTDVQIEADTEKIV